jgi:hypothetical protein
MQRVHHDLSRSAFVHYELPLVLALLGIVAGAFLWIWNGRLTIGASVAFGFILPFAALMLIETLDHRLSRKVGNDEGD